MTEMKSVKRDGEWWITNMPDDEPDCGGYPTKADAEDDRKGLVQFFKHSHKRSFWTGDK